MLLLNDILCMSSTLRLATFATIAGLLARSTFAQTYTSCNPLHGTCPPDPALGKSISIDLTSQSDEFTESGQEGLAYGSNGASFTITGPGDAPELISNWYIMFGKYEVVMNAAPGAGIVSTLVLQSDDLDEIDWEFLGADNDQVQTNYFGKGDTTTYDREITVAASDSQSAWHTYSLEWTQDQIVWQVDGSTVRTLTPQTADANQYPQTPCKLKIGSWSAGDPSQPPGTIAWAQGPTNYADGPFVMYVKSVAVTDYSTGSQYSYGDDSGDWTSIQSSGGKINGNEGGSIQAASPPTTSTFPWSTDSADSSSVTATTYPGLPSGWTVNPSTGKVVPPSSASAPSPSALSTHSPAVSPAALSSDCAYKTVTTYNDQGFLTTETIPVGASSTWDEKGLPVTIYPAGCKPTSGSDSNGFAEKVAKIMDFPASTTAKSWQSDLSILEFMQKNKQSGAHNHSGGSKTTARWCAAFGTLLSAVIMAVLMS